MSKHISLDDALRAPTFCPDTPPHTSAPSAASSGDEPEFDLSNMDDSLPEPVLLTGIREVEAITLDSWLGHRLAELHLFAAGMRSTGNGNMAQSAEFFENEFATFRDELQRSFAAD